MLLAARLRPGTARWSAPGVAVSLGQYLWPSPDGPSGGYLRVATNGRREALAGWVSTHRTGVGSRAGLAVRAAGSSEWLPIELPARMASVGPPRISLGEDGAMFAALASTDGASIVAAVRLPSWNDWELADLGRGKQLLGLTVGPGASALTA